MRAPDHFPEPVDLWGAFDPPILPEGLLPQTIEDFARVQGGLMGADPGGLAMAALTVCAAALSDKIKVQVKEHDESWTESARIWTALVGPPSTKKSPILGQAFKPLAKIDAGLYREFAKASAEYHSMSKDEQKLKNPPPHKRLRIEDTTIESAQEILKDSPDGLLCFQDELSGWFGAMEKYSGARGAQKDRSFWLQSFNGGSYAVSRIGRGHAFIDNLSVCILGGIQPDLIRKMAADTHDDGLLQRLFPIVLQPATVGKDEPTPPVVPAYHELVENLHRMNPPRLGGGNLGDMMDTVLRFDDGAQHVRRFLEEEHLNLISAEVINKKLAAHIGKLDGLFARLCVLFHCIEHADHERPPQLIAENTAERVGMFLMEFLRVHAVAFYANTLGLSDDHETLAAVAGYILAHPQDDAIQFRDLQRGTRATKALTKDEGHKLLERMEYLGWLVAAPMERNRTAPRWTVNPRVREKFTQRARAEVERRHSAMEAIRTLAGSEAAKRAGL